ncbi:MAG: hypothetical protein ACFHXK_07875 [bacterium]
MKRLFDSKKDNPRSTHQRHPGASRQNKARSAYQAVSIYSRSDCCEAAQRITGKKFLAAHAPQLPLGGCDQPAQCRCRYKHMADRREEMRRDTDNGLPARHMYNGERRNRRDRRRQIVH